MFIVSKLVKMTDAKIVTWRRQTMSLILIVSVYTDLSPFEFGKIQVFFLKIWQNIDFLGMCKGFLYIFFTHTDFPPKIQIFFVIYPEFILDQSGRSSTICKTKGQR